MWGVPTSYEISEGKLECAARAMGRVFYLLDYLLIFLADGLALKSVCGLRIAKTVKIFNNWHGIYRTFCCTIVLSPFIEPYVIMIVV